VIEVYNEVADEFNGVFGRSYPAIEAFMMDDAEFVLIMSNSFTVKGKAAVKEFRENGIKAGLLRLRLIRPFPDAELKLHLSNRKAAAVIDQNISPGSGGILYKEVSAALYHEPDRPEVLLSFIGGLGGKDISPVEFKHIFDMMKKSLNTGIMPETEILYTENDMQQMNKLLKIAGKTND